MNSPKDKEFEEYNERRLVVRARETTTTERIRLHTDVTLSVPPGTMVVENPFLGGSKLEIMSKASFQSRFDRSQKRTRKPNKSTIVDNENEGE